MTTESTDSLVDAAMALAGRMDLLPATPPGLARLEELGLAGLRRAREGRGGATAVASTIRTLIRCPLLGPVAALFPAQRTGRPTPSAAYWLFYMCLAREVGSFEAADQEIEAAYPMVCAEFAARGIRLPARKPGTTNPVPGYAGFKTWRREHVQKAGRLPAMADLLTATGRVLAQAIRDAEGRASGDPLNPNLSEILSGDASVFAPPSNVHIQEYLNEATGEVITAVAGSRAVTGAARIHEQGGSYSRVKTHGISDGFYHVVLSSKGYDSYTRVVLGVDIAESGQAESDAAVPLLHRVLDSCDPDEFLVVSYDGQLYPRHALELMRRHGVHVTNHNAIRSATSDEAEDPDTVGISMRSHGQYRRHTVRTYASVLPTLVHTTAAGRVCAHHLVSDDGAVWEVDRPAVNGKAHPSQKKLRMHPPTRLRRHRTGEQEWTLELEVTIGCPHGNLSFTTVLTQPQETSKGSVGWSQPAAALRVIPPAWTDRFAVVFGARNQSESFFSWLEKRYYHKDRVASWGHDAQLLDLIAAALLANTEAWAHYAVRHRDQAAAAA